MTDFLLELRSEEIPARMQAKAREDLVRLFADYLPDDVSPTEVITYATPRRLALIAHGLPNETPAVRIERKGPRADAPEAAIAGFLRSTGLTRDQLEERPDGRGGATLFAVIERSGEPMVEALKLTVSTIVSSFPWPKSMRWGTGSSSTDSLRWVRPLQGIVALFGDALVDVGDPLVPTLRATKGHRFHHPGDIKIGGAHDYVEKLRACHVIVDQDERSAIIATGATMLTAGAGLTLIRDEGLLAENAGLTEWPVPLLGRFDAAYLDVPPEVIQLTARVNQKYFVCLDGVGPDAKLANAFVCVANIDASDGGDKIVEGNRKVLAARLSDARFFYETDLKTRLEDQLPKLDKIVFHEKLGTVADKVERVAKLARWLVEEGIVTNKPLPFRGGVGGGGVPQTPSPAERGAPPPPPPRGGGGGGAPPVPQTPSPAESPHPNPSPEGEGLETLATLTERAARLCKADLVTGMVGEFPELQGLIGGYYAAAQGEDPQVAAAIRDHYKPVGQGDEVPTAPVTVAVSLADKLDTLASFFVIGEVPTGSRDPFALRRAALGALRIILAEGARFSLARAILKAFGLTMRAFTYDGVDWKTDPPRVDELIDDLDVAERRFVESRIPIEFYNLNEARSVRDEPAGTSPYPRTAAIPSPFQQRGALLDFFADRLKVQQREAGVRHDLIDAVFALGGEDDLVRLLARVRALQAFVGTDDGANLLAGYKRAANILKKEGWAPSPLVGEGRGPLASASGKGEGGATSAALADTPHPSAPSALPPSPTGGEGNIPLSYTPEIAETALIAALDAAEPAAAAAVAGERFEAAMTALATLRAPIDAFFDSVTVNDPDPTKRAARLALLARVRAAVHAVADFSKIEG